MKINAFSGARLRRTERRLMNSAPFARIKDVVRLRGDSAYPAADVIVYTHPTKGYRSRRWVSRVPMFASKIDMMNHIWYNLGRIKAQQVQAGIAPDLSP